MEKYFVNYEQSLALKELGFDEPCFGVFYLIPETKKWEPYRIMEESNHNKSNFSISRPLIGQVFQWFREKHDLLSIIFKDYIHYWFEIEKDDNEKHASRGYDTYEEAESACIDKLIEIVKE